MRADTFPLFTYGTLQYPDVLEAVAARTYASEPARLPDYRRRLVYGQVYPGAVSAPGEIVEGRLYPAVDAGVRGRLDRFEGPLYERRLLPVIRADGTLLHAAVYVVPDRYRGRLAASDWDAARFEQAHRAAYVRSCRALRIADVASGEALRREHRSGF